MASVNQALAHGVAVVSVIGAHGGKQRDDILRDKRNDISVAGKTFWAFQSVAAPPPLVQQLAVQTKGAPVLLIAPKGRETGKQPTSRDTAVEFSPDGKSWQRFPSNIGDVTGRLTGWGTALVLTSLVQVSLELDLSDYEDFVHPTHPAKTARGASTICVQRRCRTAPSSLPTGRSRRKLIAIGWLGDPYAVWLR